MDIDYLKSASSDEQMEMMLMMDIGKLSEYSSGGSSSNDIGMMDLSSGSIPHVNDNSHVAESPFMNFPSNISFSSFPNMHQDPLALPFVPTTTGTNGIAFLTESQKRDSVVAMREMIFRMAAMQPVQIDLDAVKPPKRRNVKISKDPQSVAARHRRERISEKIRILQRLVPGGTKMDTASMLDEAIHYVKFLKDQVQSLESVAANRPVGVGFPVPMTNGCSYLPVSAAKGGYKTQNLQHYADA